MSLVGNLEDLGLGEILQIVSLSRRSGVLSLASRGREARIVFQNGQVTRASSTTFQQNLGEVLIQKGVIDLPTLKRALSIQADEEYRQLLGAIMIERFSINADAIETVVREQIENVVYSLFAWAEGTFEFELQEIAPGDAAKLDPVQFMLNQGLNPQYLAMEGSRIIDEKRHRGETDEDYAPEPSLDLAFDLLQQPAPPVAGSADPAPAPEAVQDSPSDHDDTPPVPHAASPAGQATHFPGHASPHATSAPRSAPAPRSASAAAAAARQGRPLVLVDDDPATLTALAALLEEHGYRVEQIDRSEDALIRIDCMFRDGIRPTVVVDLIMPRMDGTGILGGLELMELVRNNFPDLPLLAISDFRNEDAQRKSRAMGVPIVMKPLKGELADGIPPFTPNLLAALARVESGGAGVSLSRVNIGDELRLEMGEEPALPVPVLNQSIGISQLRGMLEELNNPSLGGEIILLVLRFAAEFMNRAVVLLVKKDTIQGLGQFGIEDRDGSADARIRELSLPRREPSLFAPVLETRFPLKGEVDDTPWTQYFLDQLGPARPPEIFVGPIVSEGKVVAVLYGDNLPEEKPIGDTDSLEIFLSQAGVAMERALLQRRLQDQAQGGS